MLSSQSLYGHTTHNTYEVRGHLIFIVDYMWCECSVHVYQVEPAHSPHPSASAVAQPTPLQSRQLGSSRCTECIIHWLVYPDVVRESTEAVLVFVGRKVGCYVYGAILFHELFSEELWELRTTTDLVKQS